MNAKLPLTAEFVAQIGSQFLVHPESESTPVVLKLLQVEPLGRSGHEGCSLRFSGPDLGDFAHRTYLLQHASLGVFQLFLGPVVFGRQSNPAAGELCYQAIINRPKPGHHNPPKETRQHE